MKRRELLGALGAGAASLAAFSGSAALAQEGARKGDRIERRHDKMHDKLMNDCLDACGECAKVCDQTFHHCFMEVSEGKKEHAQAMHLAGDCAGFCSLSACMIARHSPLMVESCQACADACAMTIKEVEKFDSPEMKNAVRALRNCEKSCREMIKTMASHEGHTEAAK